MARKKIFTVDLQSEKSHTWNSIDLEISGDINPNSIFDAINRLKLLRGEPKVNRYERISFNWNSHQINLTNPAVTGQDPQPYFSPNTEGYQWTKEFLGAYFTEPKKEEPKKEEPKKEEPKKEGPWIDELGPSSGWSNLPEPEIPDDFHKGDFLDTRSDWQTRWNNAMQHSRDVRARDWRLKHRHKATVEFAAGNIAKEMSESNNPVSDIVAIAHILRIGFDTGFKLLSFLPEEIAATADRFQMNLEIVSLSIERLITIVSGMFDIVSKSWAVASKLDWNKALNMTSKWLDNQERALQYGIETGMLDKDYNPTGAEKWQIPQTTPNSPEEFKKWLAISGLTHCPFVGSTVEDVMRFELLRQYQERTGVGIPDDYAWLKYVLGNQIGVTVPIQDAMDIAGQIPDWFLEHTQELARIGKQVHEVEHKEIKQLKH